MAERKQPAVAASKPQAKAPKQTAVKPVYATVRLLPNFQVGDRLDGHLDPSVLELVLENGDGSYEKPKS